MNILICEDNPIVAMDLGWMLQDMGHRVCGTAATSIRGMEQCALKNPDLVLVDLNLADGRTGLGLVEALAQLHVPAVIVSGETHTVPRATSARAVLSKPFDEERLAQALAVVAQPRPAQASVSPTVVPADTEVADGAGIAGPAHPSRRGRGWIGWFWRRAT